ncbi:TolC family protein [Actimicrobium antarcticum]|uniref:TolC family protein n=1 Tax=Actimicrobium antarcticum TaxID=1051899 RepID=A0ABP7TRZ8_9BURK
MSVRFLAPSRLCSILLVPLLWSSPLHAADLALTLPAAQQRALLYSRQLPAFDAATSSAQSLAVAAGQLPDPILKLGIDNLPANGEDRFSLTRDFMTMRRVGVMQELTGADKRRLRRDVQLRQADKSTAQKFAAAAELRRATAMAWLERSFAEQKLALVDAQLEQARQEISAAESAYRSNGGRLADVLAARSTLILIDDQQRDLSRKVRNAGTMLERWTGPLGPTTLAASPDMHQLSWNPATLDRTLASESQIAVLSAQEQVARTDALLAQAEKKNDWTIEVGYAQRGPAYSNMLSVGVSIPLPWDQANRQDRTLAARLATADQATAERDEALRERIAQTRILLDEWQTDRARHRRYQDELIPLAKQRTEATLAAWRGGKATLPELLLARRNEIDVALMTLDHEAATARLWAQLNFLLADAPAASLGETP